MKKLLLITGILLSTSLWASPMDKICSINASLDLTKTGKYLSYISENCERNNILQVTIVTDDASNFLETHYCRFDRNVNKTLAKAPSTLNVAVDYYLFNCVLYSNQPREVID